ncbi:MAG: cobalamin biosynthesis protein [Chloroflexi bacterium]|nr:cobalamin biosynthesis protein [Chloroflexota bacterium]
MEDKIAGAAKLERLAPSAAPEKPGNIIVATGRGGTGKSTFVALASRYLTPPLLLLDIDPDQSLADMLGVDLETTRIKTDIGREVKIKTVSDLTRDIVDEDAFMELGGGIPAVKIPLLLEWYTRYSSEKFTLISLGPRWTAGDYRAANYLFEFVIPSIGGDYTNIVVDSPAGLEHLNRKVIPDIDDLFLILDPSMKSMKHVARVRKITGEVGISYKHFYLVGNYEFDDEAEALLKRSGETYLGKMDYDTRVKDYNLKGESLLNLPESSPACLSVRRILAKAGYKISLASTA